MGAACRWLVAQRTDRLEPPRISHQPPCHSVMCLLTYPDRAARMPLVPVTVITALGMLDVRLHRLRTNERINVASITVLPSKPLCELDPLRVW